MTVTGEEPFIQRNNLLQQPIFYPLIYSQEENDAEIKPLAIEALKQILNMF